MNSSKIDNQKELERVITKVGNYRSNKPFPSRSTVIVQTILSILILSLPLILSAKAGFWKFLEESNLMVIIHLLLLIVLTGILITIANQKFDLKNRAEKIVLVFPLCTLGFYGVSLLVNYLRMGDVKFYALNIFITMSERYLIRVGIAFSIYIFINAIKNTTNR